MIILPDRHAPVGKFLLPQARLEWMASSQRPSFEPLEHGTLTRWRVTASLHDGHIAWRGWFDDREDVDAFLFAMASGSLAHEHPLWDLPTPSWHPGLAPEAYYAVATVTFITATGAGTYTVPSDYNSSNNSIETIGGGFTGSGGSGGGAAYSGIVNLALTPGASINRTVAAVAGDSWFNGASLAASSVGSKGATSITGAATTSGIGTIKYAGGDGANGGGGAAGPNGAGNTAPGTGVGGQGDKGLGGAGGTKGADGASGGTNGGNASAGNPGGGGTEWDASHGSGGGGGQGGTGGSSNGSAGSTGGNGGNGGAGGLYGAGGGNGGAGGSGNPTPGGAGGSGVGRQGIIVVTYTPATSAGFSISMLGM
jgi:hypothetical protein